MYIELIISIIGWLAIFFNVIGFYIYKNRKLSIFFIFLSTICFGIGLLNYEGYSGFIISILSSITQIFAFFGQKKLRKIFTYLQPINALIVFFIVQDSYSYLPAIATLFAGIAILQSRMMYNKILFIFCNQLWLIYGILLGSPEAIVFDVVGFFTILFSIYKLKKYENQEKSNLPLKIE